MSDKDEATRPVCKLTECQGKPRCRMCLAMDARYAAPPDQSERIAALDKLPQRYIGASVPLQMVLHMAALETALGQAKVALGALLTHMGMDEDEWNKPTFDQARAVLRAIEEVRK